MPETSTLEIVDAPSAVAVATPTKGAIALAATVEDKWERAKRFVTAATLFQRASLAAQIMAGLMLIDLYKAYGIKKGKRTDLPHNAGSSESWPDAVRKRLGISDDTAYRWMDMARAAKPRLTKGDIDLGAILEKNPGALTQAEQELLQKAVHKISDGKTQLEFMLECGAVKAPQGSAARGGALGGAGKNRTGNAEALAKLANIQVQHIKDMLTEALMDKPWIACDKANREELHGLLVDATAAVAKTLKPARS